jgi:hypothetical protein
MRTLASTMSFLLFVINLNAQNTDWKNIAKVQKSIGNITYTFPAAVSEKERENYIKVCEKSIRENLVILGESSFTNKMDVEFLNSRNEMQKYTGIAAQGRAMYQQNAMFSLLKKTAPIKHELMHMIATYKWGDSADFWIDEGLATYSGGTCSKYTLEEIYQYYIQSEKLIPINLLTGDDFLKYNDIITYTQSAFIVEYLLENYDLNKFKRLWKEGFKNFEEIYMINFEVVQNKINEKLKAKYTKNIVFNWEEFDKGCQ